MNRNEKTNSNPSKAPVIVKESKKEGCYIATCIYGSYDCSQVRTLRRFRDDIPAKTWYGKLFIKCYYAISPTMVKFFGYQKWFRAFWKSKLDRIVECLNNGNVDAR